MDGGDDDDIIGFEPGSKAYAGTIAGGAGHDSIHGSRYADDIFGGPGNDEIWAHGEDADEISCGGGWDEVYVDESDIVASSCERATLGAGPTDPRLEHAIARALDFRSTPL